MIKREKPLPRTRNAANASLAIVFNKWFHYEVKPHTSVEEFIEKSNLNSIITTNDFNNILSEKAYFDTETLYVIRNKLPFNIKINTLHQINKNVQTNNPNAILIPTDKEFIREQTLLIDEQKRKKQNLATKNWREREENKEYIQEYKKEWAEKNPEKIQNSRDKSRDKKNRRSLEHYYEEHDTILARRRELYAEKKEKKKLLGAIMHSFLNLKISNRR